MVDIVVPEAATTVLIFCPMLALLAWKFWASRQAVRRRIDLGNKEER